MKKRWIAVLLLGILVSAVGCQKAESPSDQSILKNRKSETVEETSALEDSRRKEGRERVLDRISGIYRVNNENLAEKEEELAELSVVGGSILLEHQYFMDGGMYSFYVEEITPDDDALFREEATEITGRGSTFSIMSAPDVFLRSVEDIRIVPTDTGFLKYSSGVRDSVTEYVKLEEQEGLHQEDLTQLREGILSLSESWEQPDEYVGEYSSEGEGRSMYLDLRKDGSFLSSVKESREHMDVAIGFWGINEEGKLRTECIYLGTGESSYSYTIDIQKNSKGLLLSDSLEDFFLTGLEEVQYTPVQGDYIIPKEISEMPLPIITRVLEESGEYQDEYGQEVTYSFSYPRINDEGTDAEKINAELSEKFGGMIEEMLAHAEKGEQIGIANMDYEVYEWLDTYVILMKWTDYFSGEEYFENYFYSSRTKKAMSKEQFLTELDQNPELFLDAVHGVVLEKISEYFGGASLLSQEEYDGLIESAHELVTMDNIYFRLGTYGEILVLAPIPSPAGAGYFYEELQSELSEERDTQESTLPSFSDASEILIENLEMQGDSGIAGMSFLEEDTELLHGEECLVISAGTNHAEQFVREYHFAVSPTGAVYRYDVLEDQWTAYNAIAGIAEHWSEDTLFGVVTDPYSQEMFSYYAAEADYEHVLLLPMQDGVRFHIQKLEYDEELQDVKVVEEIKTLQGNRGQAFYEEIWVSEGIPAFRVTAEKGNKMAYWDSVHNGLKEVSVEYIRAVEANNMGVQRMAMPQREEFSMNQNSTPTMTLLSSTGGSNPSWTMEFSRLPKSAEELSAMISAQDLLKQPYQTAALTVAVLCNYPLDKESTLKMLDILNGPAEISAYDKQFLADRFRDKDYVPRSFFAGSSPENHYTPTEPYTITVYENPYSRQSIGQGYLNILVQSSGADSLRHIKLRTKPSTGEWFLSEQMILSDIRIPAAADPWA